MANEKVDLRKRNVDSNPNVMRNITVTVPDGGYGWFVCLACFVGNLTCAGPTLSYGIILPALKEYYKDGVFIISLVGSIMSTLGFVFGPVAAVLTIRMGLRCVYILGSVLFGASLIAATFAQNAYMLLLTYGVFAGISFGLLLFPSTIGCNYYFERKRGLSNGISKAGVSLAVFFYPPMTELILSRYDWKTAVYVYAGILLGGSFFGGLIKPLELVKIIKNEEHEQDGSTNKEKQNRGQPTFVKDSKSFGEEDDRKRRNEKDSGNVTSKTSNSFDFVKEKDSNNKEFRRRSSIVKIQNILEDDPNTVADFIFSPTQKRGSGIFLPPLAKTDYYYDRSICSKKKKTHEEHSLESHSPSFKTSNTSQRISIVSLNVLDMNLVKNQKLSSCFSDTFDHELCCNTALWLYFIHHVAGNFGQSLFFMFIPILLMDLGFTIYQASLVIMVNGITNLIGRVVSGFFMDRPWMNNFILTAIGFFVVAAVLCAFPFCNNFAMLMAFSGAIGVLMAPYQIGMSIILGEMLPLEKAATSSGLMSVAMGIGSIMGPPIAGFIYDYSKNSTIIFFIIATGFFIGGISCWLAGSFHNNRKDKSENSL